ncbi:hypothetical protein JCM3774_004546 [Rhodotorula dairenensis]
MAISVLSSPPEALSREELAAISSSTPSTFQGIAPLTRHHEPSGVTLRLEPAFEGFTGAGLEGALYVTEGALSFYSEAAQQGISIPYPHITLHAISRDPVPVPTASTSNGASTASSNGAATTTTSPAQGACIYCQIEESDDDVLEDTDGMEESGTREMWITPADPDSVEKIFSMLSYCASLHPANADPSASFMNADADPSTAEDGSLGGQASLFASMGLDPSSMVFANPDGSLGGPGLAAMQQQQQQFEDGAEGEDGTEEAGAGEESSAGRQRSDFVNEGRARGAPY